MNLQEELIEAVKRLDIDDSQYWLNKISKAAAKGPVDQHSKDLDHFEACGDTCLAPEIIASAFRNLKHKDEWPNRTKEIAMACGLDMGRKSERLICCILRLAGFNQVNKIIDRKATRIWILSKSVKNLSLEDIQLRFKENCGVTDKHLGLGDMI